MQVENMRTKSGTVPNQFIIRTENQIIFQSYRTIIAIKKSNGDILLDKENWDYSNTTGRYRNYFLNETKRETEKKIKLGIYKLDNLQNYEIN